ncbi:hypothetical protein PHMEG_0008900 [Phytophthora megakarya]|uniref:Uncharacterized protein n=1 Tax=Phytophthora megakarya TaxID=4795 RepID=A0A225WI01_9STRA|nr:hypothetical protein PHMEG_0008900 [Phytophthora megakarya]
MVRVPGSSGDTQGFHRESDEDVTKIKLKPGIETSAEGVPPQTLLSEAGYTQRLRAGRNSDDTKEEGAGSKKKKPKTGKKKLKNPDSDGEVRDERTWTEEELAQNFHKKDLFVFLLENSGDDDPASDVERRIPRPDEATNGDVSTVGSCNTAPSHTESHWGVQRE